MTDDDDNDIMWCEIYYRISHHKSSLYCVLLVNYSTGGTGNRLGFHPPSRIRDRNVIRGHREGNKAVGVLATVSIKSLSDDWLVNYHGRVPETWYDELIRFGIVENNHSDANSSDAQNQLKG